MCPLVRAKLEIPDCVPDHALFYFPKPTLLATNGGLHREVYPHDQSVNAEALMHIINWTMIDAKPQAKPISLPQVLRNAGGPWFQLIKGELDNQLYMLNHYHVLPNANRGWSIKESTRRSQISHLPGVIEEFYRLLQSSNRQTSKIWLQATGLPLLSKYHKYWQGPEGSIKFDDDKSMIGNRWFGYGDRPPSEVYGEDFLDRRIHAEHKFYYHRALADIVKWKLGAKKPSYAVGFDLDRLVEKVHPEQLKKAQILSIEIGKHERTIDLQWTDSNLIEPGYKTEDGSIWRLKPLFYAGDRACRASGKDPIHAWGPYGAFTTDFMTIGQNALLYKQSKLLAKLYQETDQAELAEKYQQEAAQRKDTLLAYNRDEKSGLFYSYDTYEKRLHSSYLEGDVVYAVYAGILDISDKQQRGWLTQLLEGIDHHLLGPSGIYGAAENFGLNWEKPHCWPPHQVAFLLGLNHYLDQIKHSPWSLVEQEEIAELRELLLMLKRKLMKAYLNASQKEFHEKGILAENLNEISQETSTGYQTQESLYSWRATSVLLFYLEKLKLDHNSSS